MSMRRGTRQPELGGPLRSLAAKIAVSPLVAVAWLASARLVITQLGVDGYATFAIIAGIAVLLPFTDLGTGSAVMDAMARRGRPGVAPIERVLLTTWRALCGVGLGLIAIGVGIAAAGWWAPVLGVPDDASVEVAVAVVLCVFALGLPVSVGPRMLTGGGLNHWAVALQALSAVLMVLMIATAAALSIDRIEVYVLSPFAAAAISNAIALVVAAHRFDVSLMPVAGRLLNRAAVGAKVRHLAGPMMIISIVLPLAYQTDRIVLSHVRSLADVASYSLAFQIFSPLLGLIGSAGVALWPIFAQARDHDDRIPRHVFWRHGTVFAVMGVLLAGAFVALGPWLMRLIGSDTIAIPPDLIWSFAGLLLLQALTYPLTMILTHADGLRFQAKLHIAMLLVNLPLSIWFASLWGASGPVVASLVAIGTVLFVPLAARARHSIRGDAGPS